MATLLDVPKLGSVLDDAYTDLFGVAPHIENESSTRNLLAKRIVGLARMVKPIPNCSSSMPWQALP